MGLTRLQEHLKRNGCPALRRQLSRTDDTFNPPISRRCGCVAWLGNESLQEKRKAEGQDGQSSKKARPAAVASLLCVICKKNPKARECLLDRN